MGDQRSFPAEAQSLESVRLFIRELARATSFSDAQAADLVLAVSESCTILLRSGGPSSMNVQWRVSQRQIDVEISDHTQVEMGGLATAMTVQLIKRLVDVFEISDAPAAEGRTLIRLIKRLT